MSTKVQLLSESTADPIELSSHAAKTCYTSKVPEMGKTIDVRSRLFNTGHHSTIQHNYYTFNIDNMSESNSCFGLYMLSPFYASDQRSGRFSKMYQDPNFAELQNHLLHFYDMKDVNTALNFIIHGYDIYAANKLKLDAKAKDIIKQERPSATEKYIEQNAPKLAQEQLRMFLSMAFPTSLDYTINLSALASLYRTAWNPELKQVIQQMVNILVAKYPHIEFMFDPKHKSTMEWNPKLLSNNNQIKYKPTLTIEDINVDSLVLPEEKDKVYLGLYDPNCSENSVNYIRTKVNASAGTMRQDQRHRSIKRGPISFTGDFYLPPLLNGLSTEAKNLNNEFLQLHGKIPETLWTMVAPYGTMVEYTKLADINALLNEQQKRTCWCAQEEIYHLSTSLRKQLIEKLGSKHPLIDQISPACYKDGKCCEGVRYCGRNIIERLITTNYFKDRQI